MKHCRGGYATEGDFVMKDGTALHWAAFYGQCHAAELLIEKGAGAILFSQSFIDKKR